MRSARFSCSPRRGHLVGSGAGAADVVDASDVEGSDVNASASVDTSGIGTTGGGGGSGTSDDARSGVDVSGVDVFGADTSGDSVSCVDGSSDGDGSDDGFDVGASGAAAGGSCSPWNGCWSRRAISAKAPFISGDTALARASFISGEVAPGILCCTHVLKVVGLSLRLGMCLNHSMPGLGRSGRLRRPDRPY